MNRQHYKDVNMTRLETWLGADKIAKLRADMKDWYGRPICLIDCPGSVWIHADGSFTGTMKRGYFYSAMDSFEEWVKRIYTESGRLQYGQCNAGFTSIDNVLSRAAQGYSQRLMFDKAGVSSTLGFSSSLWRSATQPASGAGGGAAPGGTAHTKSNTGALSFANPSSGTLHLIDADVATTLTTSTLLLYDRLFSVNKTMSSSTTEAVTGVPTRYQSTTATGADYAGDNFLFVETYGTLGSGAHNWTVCQYTNQAGTTTKTLPSLTGLSGAANGRFDHGTANQWFAPLDTDDTGIQSLTQMQCSSATITGTLSFVIGHPIGFMSFPIPNVPFPFDWLITRDQAPRVFDDACLCFIEPNKTITTTGGNYSGKIVLTTAAA